MPAVTFSSELVAARSCICILRLKHACAVLFVECDTVFPTYTSFVNCLSLLQLLTAHDFLCIHAWALYIPVHATHTSSL